MSTFQGTAWKTAESQPADQPSIDGLIGLFELKEFNETSVPAQSLLHESTSESIFDPDHRVVVDPSEYRDGGVYRSIVKLQMRYERQTGSEAGWYMGTGWLITPDIMVTAGHNVYNWSGGDDEEGLGKAVVIKCHIGYYGKESVGKDPSVQSRLARRIVTSAEWLQNKNNRHRDFAFIQVDRPFSGDLRLFTYEPTPMAGIESIGVVGYPGDKCITDKAGREERGARMYKQFAETSYDRKISKFGLLSYRISTFGGQSGAPVIRYGKQVGIATHVYGSGDKNQASPIIDYANFFNALTKNFPRVGSIDNIGLYKPKAVISESSPEAEGFFDVLKSIGGVVATVGQVVVPAVSTALLGPVGAPISAIAGTALGVLGKVCSESALDGAESSAEDMYANTDRIVKNGEVQRAVVAEATLQALEKLHKVNPAHPGLKRLHAHMGQSYDSMRPCLKVLAPHFKHHLIRAAAVLGCSTDIIEKSGAPTITSDLAQPIPPASQGTAESAYSGGNDFATALLEPTKQLKGEEAFFETLGSFFRKALEVSKPVLRETAAAGLIAISKRLAAPNAAESASESGEFADETNAATLVLKRAAIAECALQAVSTLNAEQLADLRISSEHDLNQESFIDFIKGAAQRLGGAVQKAAPIIIKHVIPAVIKAATGGQESARDAPAAQKVPNNDPWELHTQAVGFNGSNGGQQNSTWGSTSQQDSAQRITRQPSRIFMNNEHEFGTAPGYAGIAVSDIPPADGALIEQHPVAARTDALQRKDSNEDLPVYQIYD